MLDELPRADRLAAHIRRLILTGHFHAGDTLPSSREAARRYDVDRSTVHKAYKRLRIAGLIEGRAGRPDRVASCSESLLETLKLIELRNALHPLLELADQLVPETDVPSRLRRVDDSLRRSP